MSHFSPDTRESFILLAVDKLRQRKARPDLFRILSWLSKRYEFDRETVETMLENMVRQNKLFRVCYKGDISYRNPKKYAKWRSGSMTVEQQQQEELEEQQQTTSQMSSNATESLQSPPNMASPSASSSTRSTSRPVVYHHQQLNKMPLYHATVDRTSDRLNMAVKQLIEFDKKEDYRHRGVPLQAVMEFMQQMFPEWKLDLCSLLGMLRAETLKTNSRLMELAGQRFRLRPVRNFNPKDADSATAEHTAMLLAAYTPPNSHDNNRLTSSSSASTSTANSRSRSVASTKPRTPTKLATATKRKYIKKAKDGAPNGYFKDCGDISSPSPNSKDFQPNSAFNLPATSAAKNAGKTSIKTSKHKSIKDEENNINEIAGGVSKSSKKRSSSIEKAKKPSKRVRPRLGSKKMAATLPRRSYPPDLDTEDDADEQSESEEENVVTVSTKPTKKRVSGTGKAQKTAKRIRPRNAAKQAYRFSRICSDTDEDAAAWRLDEEDETGEENEVGNSVETSPSSASPPEKGKKQQPVIVTETSFPSPAPAARRSDRTRKPKLHRFASTETSDEHVTFQSPVAKKSKTATRHQLEMLPPQSVDTGDETSHASTLHDADGDRDTKIVNTVPVDAVDGGKADAQSNEKRRPGWQRGRPRKIVPMLERMRRYTLADRGYATTSASAAPLFTHLSDHEKLILDYYGVNGCNKHNGMRERDAAHQFQTIRRLARERICPLLTVPSWAVDTVAFWTPQQVVHYFHALGYEAVAEMLKRLGGISGRQLIGLTRQTIVSQFGLSLADALHMWDEVEALACAAPVRPSPPVMTEAPFVAEKTIRSPIFCMSPPNMQQTATSTFVIAK